MIEIDFLVIGAGIAGASIAFELAAHGRVSILEREALAGYHATGRSAATFNESYGHHPVTRILARGSRAFFHSPPPGFSEYPLLSRRGTLIIASKRSSATLDEAESNLKGLVRRLTADEVVALVPVLRRDWLAGGLLEPEAADIDVGALHQGFLRCARDRGATLRTNAAVRELKRDGARWIARIADGDFSARVVINAAGAWGDEIARLAGLPLQRLEARQRSAFTFAAPSNTEVAAWPQVKEVEERFYFKPESGRILASPANQQPVPPHDVQPDDLDIALGVERLQTCSSLVVDRVYRKWAGLRTFAPNRGLVAGFAASVSGFFWLVGQGGSGIKTAPAAARLACSLIVERTLPPDLVSLGLSMDMVAPLS